MAHSADTRFVRGDEGEPGVDTPGGAGGRAFAESEDGAVALGVASGCSDLRTAARSFPQGDGGDENAGMSEGPPDGADARGIPLCCILAALVRSDAAVLAADGASILSPKSATTQRPSNPTKTLSSFISPWIIPQRAM